MPDEKNEIVKKIEEKKQNPEKIEDEVKQVSEFEKDEMFDTNRIAALIDKSKEEQAETTMMWLGEKKAFESKRLKILELLFGIKSKNQPNSQNQIFFFLFRIFCFELFILEM